MVFEELRLRMDGIAEVIGISHGCVNHILPQELVMKKLCIRWLLFLVSSNQKVAVEEYFTDFSGSYYKTGQNY